MKEIKAQLENNERKDHITIFTQTTSGNNKIIAFIIHGNQKKHHHITGWYNHWYICNIKMYYLI